MVTNFSHMKPWNAMYQKLLFMEDVILDIKNKESCIQIVSTSRGVIDILLKELVKENRITDAQIIQVKKQTSMNAQDQARVDLFGRIKALEALGYISKNTAENLHYIRKYGNQATHGEETFINNSQEELKKIAEKVYEILYRETYLFANQYVPAARAGNKGTPVGKESNSSSNNTTGIVVTIIVIVLALIFFGVVGIASMGFMFGI